MHHSISQMKHQLDATLWRFYFCRVTLHVSGASAHHHEYLKLVQRPLVHVLSLWVSHHISLLGPEHVEWLCRNKTCTVLHQVGVSFDWFRLSPDWQLIKGILLVRMLVLSSVIYTYFTTLVSWIGVIISYTSSKHYVVIAVFAKLATGEMKIHRVFFLSALNNLAPNGQIFMKFLVGDFYPNLSSIFKFG